MFWVDISPLQTRRILTRSVIIVMKKPWVISIAAVSGGGKTATTHELCNKLNNSKALYFDDYEFDEHPDDICDWVERGANCNEWNLLPMIKDVELLLTDQTINYILLDYPFAYLHKGMRDYIDIAIYIDTPLDIAMARRILRDYGESPVEDIRNDLMNYLVRGRGAYLNMERTVKPSSDIVVEGYFPTTNIVERILEKVENSFSSLS
jgi:uridine kinase